MKTIRILDMQGNYSDEVHELYPLKEIIKDVSVYIVDSGGVTLTQILTQTVFIAENGTYYMQFMTADVLDKYRVIDNIYRKKDRALLLEYPREEEEGRYSLYSRELLFNIAKERGAFEKIPKKMNPRLWNVEEFASLLDSLGFQVDTGKDARASNSDVGLLFDALNEQSMSTGDPVIRSTGWMFTRNNELRMYNFQVTLALKLVEIEPDTCYKYLVDYMIDEFTYNQSIVGTEGVTVDVQ